MDKKIVGPWTAIYGYCATRCWEGSDPEVVANRVAFIEKTPRVLARSPEQVFIDEEGFEYKPLQGSFDGGLWIYGPKGSGGSSEDVEKDGLYGFDPESRAWCDSALQALGYSLRES